MKYRLITLATVLILLLSACTLSLADDITPPPDYKTPTAGPTMSPLFPQNPPSLASGAAIYAEKCAPCHGDMGLGDGPMAAQLQKAPSALGKPEIGRAAAPTNWFTTVTQGNINSFMPPFNGSLNDQQRWDVVAYAMSLGGSTAAEAEKGASVYEANCAKCHGPAGDSVENADLSDQALMARLTQTDIANFVNKGVGKMPGFGGLIQDADIFAVAAYVRTFTVTAGAAAAQQPADATVTPAVAQPEATVEAGTPQATPLAEAAAELVGVVAGKISNGSGGTLPADLKAVLHVFEHDTATQQFSEIATQEAPISADGSYKFEKIPMPPTRAFYVSVNYADTNYESEPIFPKDGQTSLDMPLTVYDTTTDTSSLEASQVHVLLDYSKPDIVQVVEFFILTNSGTKSVIPAEKGGPVVKINLPKGYTNLQFDQGAIGERYLKTDDGFADTTTVTPGMQKYQIIFAVDMPLAKSGLLGGRQFDLSQVFPLKVNGLSVLAPEGVTVTGSDLTPGGLQDMGTGVKYQLYTANSMEPGKSLSITASGAPAGSAQNTTAAAVNPNQNIIIGVGAFGVVLILAGIWLYWRDRQRALSDEEDELEEDDEPQQSMEDIMDAIVALDDQFKAGKIQEAAYKERRAELKSQLKETL